MRAVEGLLFLFEVRHECDAVVDTVGFEVYEVQTAAGEGVLGFAGEVDEFGEGASDLFFSSA